MLKLRRCRTKGCDNLNMGYHWLCPHCIEKKEAGFVYRDVIKQVAREGVR